MESDKDRLNRMLLGLLALTTLTLAVWGAWAGYLWHNRRLEPGPAPREQMGPERPIPYQSRK